jgi:hypothetical protein
MPAWDINGRIQSDAAGAGAVVLGMHLERNRRLLSAEKTPIVVF